MASSSSSHNRSFSDFQRETPAASKKVYDAFINHRGPDVKDTLAFALYDTLEEKECYTFLDDQELQLGDSIESAIQNAIYSSRVQIAIFSPRYAESSWCLDELLLMLETKAPFFPIFCDVKPSDLRYVDKGAYAPAFALHEEKGRFSIEKIQQWKEALHSSSLISGHEFSTSNDNVEVLCTKIALAVQREVGKTFKGFPKDGEVGKQQKGLVADAAASTSTSTQVKKSSLLPRDSHPVGIQSKVEDIVGLLENPKVHVIAVVGMGGSGKTFLLQNVFKAVKWKYDYSIWLSVSKSYSVKNLQHVIGSQTGSKSEIEDAKEIWRGAELIHDSLLGKRSLIVLDDLWSISTENSLIDELGLPDDKDCKVLISTRNRQVAENLSAQIYEMKNLSDEDSWRLFCFYAFGENRAPPHIEEEGLKIVKKCGNLPLAIKTIAASLANTTLLNKWQLKLRQLERVAATTCDPVREVMEILKMSYDSLPWHLKPCFAYLSFFPEDEEIDPEDLINLWIAEGFVPAGEEQWDMAWDWLDQLAQLCLLQVHEIVRAWSLTKYCKIHDMLHDLAIHISKESKCVFSVEEVSAHVSASTDWCRVLLAKKDVDVNAISEISPVYVRTLSLFQNEKITSIQQSLFTNMRGLRVLDLSYTKISTLPASVGKMILLKVLNLRGTKIKEVPECVRRLKSTLSFLALPYCTRLPVWIAELKRLQHLECIGVNRMPKEMSKLASLRTLQSNLLDFSIEDDEFMSLGDLVNMTQLQELWLHVNHEMELKKIEKGILAQLVKMRYLGIRNTTGEGMELPENVTAMQHLEKLTLCHFVVPSWICELASVRDLGLEGCECSNYPELQAMPNLVSLWLWRNKRCRELPKAFGKSGGFPRLRYLKIVEFFSLEEFPELEKGAMASLEVIFLSGCPKLKKVEGLEHLKRLERFCAYDVDDELREMLEEGGEYWIKIKAVNPKVFIDIYNKHN